MATPRSVFVRRVVYLMLAVVTLYGSPAAAVETDKAAHLGISHLITTGTYGVCKAMGIESKGFNVFMAIGLASIVAISKEASDPKFDSRDLLYDGIGIGTGTLFIYTFEF